MARKGSKDRKAARLHRRRKALDAMIGRHVAGAVLLGHTTVTSATAQLSQADSERAAELIRQIYAETV